MSQHHQDSRDNQQS